MAPPGLLKPRSTRRAPLSLVLDLPRRKVRGPGQASHKGEEIAEAVSTGLREGIQLRWRELRSIEVVLQEIAREFDGEAPTRPWEREALDDGKRRLEEFYEKVQEYVGAFDLPGPEEEELALLRAAIQRAAES